MHKAKVEIYTSANCSYCVRAKMLLQRKNVHFEEIPIDQDPKKRDEMMRRSQGKRTVPQIFINGESVGGFDDLWKLDQQRKLDALLEKEK